MGTRTRYMRWLTAGVLQTWDRFYQGSWPEEVCRGREREAEEGRRPGQGIGQGEKEREKTKAQRARERVKSMNILGVYALTPSRMSRTRGGLTRSLPPCRTMMTMSLLTLTCPRRANPLWSLPTNAPKVLRHSSGRSLKSLGRRLPCASCVISEVSSRLQYIPVGNMTG